MTAAAMKGAAKVAAAPVAAKVAAAVAAAVAAMGGGYSLAREVCAEVVRLVVWRDVCRL